MHPPLQLHLHSEECQRVIKQLLACHKEHPTRKYFGKCNEFKLSLNRCLQEEYVRRRQANYEQSQRRKQGVRQLLNDEN